MLEILRQILRIMIYVVPLERYMPAFLKSVVAVEVHLQSTRGFEVKVIIR